MPAYGWQKRIGSFERDDRFKCWVAGLNADDTLVIRGSFEVTHSGEFLGVPPTGRRVSYDWVDIYRVADGRIVWRYLLCDWKGLLDQLTVME